MSGPRILTLDIETSPNLAHVWSLWKQNVSLNQLMETGNVMCFAAKWLDDPQTMFWSERHGFEVMLGAAHDLLSEADAVITYNGDRFDLPTINREFLREFWSPPAPYISLDLLKAVRKNFRFHSNKLDHVVRELYIGEKAKHSGHELWVDCLRGDNRAWATMETYNRQDVQITEELALRLKPWLPNWPNPALFSDDEALAMSCPGCGGVDLKREGFRYTRVGRYQRYSCPDCGRWSTNGRRDRGVQLR